MSSMLDNNSLNMSGLSIDDIYVGRKASFSKTIEAVDVYNYAGIICDFNPIHVNKEYAATTRFGQRLVHGMLTSSFISTVFGMLLPGADAIYLGQTLDFLAPVFFGDTITVEAEVIEVIPEKRRFTAKTTITKQDGTVVVTGEGRMMANAKKIAD